MFSFFKKRKADIRSIAFPDLGWRLAKDNKDIIQWINPEETVAVTINFFDLPPDIPTVKDLPAVISSYSTSFSDGSAGIIEISLPELQGILALKTIIKLPQSPSGVTYLASIVIPFHDCSYVVKVQAIEAGATGMRDAMIGNRLLANGTTKIENNELKGWQLHTYGDTGFLMNQSEQEIYDEQFPKHPLTIARRLIKKLADDIEFKAEIKNLNAFDR